MRFRKIAESQIDPKRVTLRLIQAADGSVLGRISTLAYGEAGIEEMSTAGADPPIETALALARQLAAFKEEDIDVVDPDGLWQPDWAPLADE